MILVFAKEPTKYHYPPIRAGSDDLGLATLCGKKPTKNNHMAHVEPVNGIPTNWEPCAQCAAIDNHEKHFVGRII